MKKSKVLVVMCSMHVGGITKSLISFLNYIKDKVDVDVLLLDKTENELPLPAGVNVRSVTTIHSVRKAMKVYGVFSKEFFLSALSVLFHKRWKVMPKLKGNYDVAIAYSHIGIGKYYVIDKVNARNKYVFYHHGAYEETGKIKAFDKEYYPQYTSVVAVSEHIGQMLLQEVSEEISIAVIKNLLDIDEILAKAEEPCEAKNSEDTAMILTVGRVSKEKRTLFIPEVCAKLKEMGFYFRWYIVGDGPLMGQLKEKVSQLGVEDVCVICGAKQNPYPYMKHCDVYAQFSEFEAEPITIKEVALFGKPMVLSNIKGFLQCAEAYDNICLMPTDAKEIAVAIINAKGNIRNHLDKIRNSVSSETQKIDRLIHGDPIV